jgi:thermostable 8-oxoguanine DNA glycosylase
MEYTKETLAQWIKDEHSRCEGQMMENDMTKNEWLEIEKLLEKVAEAAGLNIWSLI